MVDTIHLVGILHTMQLPSGAPLHQDIDMFHFDEAAVGLSQEAMAGYDGDEVCGESFYSKTKTKVKQKKDKFQRQKS